VVQRVPVRIALERSELDAHPLQIGLSMKVDVDTHERSAERLQRVARDVPAYETRAFVSTIEPQVDERIERIIADNSTLPASLMSSKGSPANGRTAVR
jgi:membrane fusion protein (multidrug efflux system)